MCVFGMGHSVLHWCSSVQMVKVEWIPISFLGTKVICNAKKSKRWKQFWVWVVFVLFCWGAVGVLVGFCLFDFAVRVLFCYFVFCFVLVFGWFFSWLMFIPSTPWKYWNTALSGTNYSVTPFCALSLRSHLILHWASSNSFFATCLTIKEACWLIFLSVKILKLLSGSLSFLPYGCPDTFYITLFSGRVMDSLVGLGEFDLLAFSPSSFGLSRDLGIWIFSSLKLSSADFWTDQTSRASSPCSHLPTALEVIRKMIFFKVFDK